jgi:hypothetical protein
MREEVVRLANASGRAMGASRVRRMEEDMEVGEVRIGDKEHEVTQNTMCTI